jgi:hypothetical protein
VLFFRAGKEGNMLLPVQWKSGQIKTPNITSHILEIYDEKGRNMYLPQMFGVLI